MLDEAFPDFLFQLEPVPFCHALLDAPYQNCGRVDPFDGGGLVGGEKGNSLPGEFLFQFQRVERVAAGPLDVLADDGGEFRAGALVSVSRSATLAFGYESLVLGGSPDAIGVPSRLVAGDWSRGCCAAAVPVTFRESGSCRRAC